MVNALTSRLAAEVHSFCGLHIDIIIRWHHRSNSLTPSTIFSGKYHGCGHLSTHNKTLHH